jgi:citrate lyase subunit beta/citryl-CoA lyase
MFVPVTPLFVPGDRPERFAKAAASAADSIIIDLEDAVDASSKDAARANLLAHEVTGKPVMVRINGEGTPWWADDLEALGKARVDVVLVPKAETKAAMEAAARAVGRDVPTIALVESAVGLERLADILSASRVLCASFGSLDYALDMGCEPTWEPLLYTRSRIVYQSRLAGLAAPLDGVTLAIDDPDLVQEEAMLARAMGFGGKLSIHPKQIAPAAAAFRPSEKDVAWAERVLAAVTSDAAVKVDGQMIDKPLVEKARRIMAASAR